MVAADIQPGERIAIFLPNCWEFEVAYHAATLAGAVPTTLNPTYREREVRYQLETSDAAALVTDGSLLQGIDLSGLPSLRKVYTVRTPGPGLDRSRFRPCFRPRWHRAATSGERSRVYAGGASLLQRHNRPA